MSDTVVRITNLPESMILANIEELVKKIGPYQKIYLARDYMTRLCKVFAVVTFKQHADAAEAIQQLNGYNYDGFILIVEWSQPQYAASRATVSEDLNQPFIAKKKQEKKSNDPAIDPMPNFSKCCFCWGDHSTNDCPRKDTSMQAAKLVDVKPPTTTETIDAKPDKCVLPSSFTADAATIHITNLPESMVFADLEELATIFGPRKEIFLGRDPISGLCKGFGFVTFKKRRDAAKAIELLNGHKYGHLILEADWAKPQVAAPTATVSEDLAVPIIASKKVEKKSNDPAVDAMKNFSKCRFCGGDHSTNDCPRKDTSMQAAKLADVKSLTTAETIDAKPGKYVPPYKVSCPDATSIYITNLHKSMVFADLEDLAKKIGPRKKMFLGRDPITGLCKGFAYVTFKQHKDAAKAIELLNGHKYGHSTLIVEWAMPQVGAPTATVSECLDVPINASKKEKESNDPAVDSKCHSFGGDHSTNDCLRKVASMKTAKLADVKPSTMTETIDAKPSKCLPSHKAHFTPRCDDATSICISNLTELMIETDLEELVKKIGPYKKIYLERDRITGLCKGFAYATFKKHKDAAKAIQLLNGHGYDHLILKVDWLKPKGAATTATVSKDLNIPFITSKDIRKRHRKLADDIAMASAKLVKYIPPYKEKPAKRIRRHDYTSVRISNLPESMVEAYLESLVKNIGSCKKIFLARDRTTGLCKGFAFVTFALHDDAAKAIKLMNGRNFDDFILKVEWCKPFTQN
ncbi:RNA-binding protein 28-like isoform X2 [Sitodiplosis mosellana]|nr:RNA-binding protein 28-like isoform X2 [Sitodiplosis mosellana]XP_055309131.1 RNA-binding protein 28-like isoform X2 [Sitodiplosis mosellana]XP_055309132.1 RNA-binding protein 28-like isoform X2 [Sitodiplosis mosellana]XP_055309134.1 RNA-binding protein 28-like isoform X2 [Sitodiplosis mosellana]